MNAAKPSRKCASCGAVKNYPARDCWDCSESRNSTFNAIRAVAREWAADRKRARGGAPGRFRLRVSVFARYLAFGTCETRAEAMDEARRILAVFPEADRVQIEEFACCTVKRDGTVTTPKAVAGFQTAATASAPVISGKDLAELARLRDGLAALTARIGRLSRPGRGKVAARMDHREAAV